jgi:hypothetical protein
VLTTGTLGVAGSGWDFAVEQIPVRQKLLLTVHDSPPARVQQLYWGNRAGATYGISGADPNASVFDNAEGEVELPPRQGAVENGFFDARFQDPHNDFSRFGDGAWVDMRDFSRAAQVDTHLVTFAPNYATGSNYPMILIWDQSAVSSAYTGEVFLLDPFGVKTDMKSNDSLVVNNKRIDTLLLVAQYPNLPLSVRMEWNMISLPSLAQSSDLDIIFGNPESSPFSFSSLSGYEASGVLTPGNGYWLRCSSLPPNISSLAPPTPLPESIAVSAGWNLIGSAATAVSVTQISSSPPGIFGVFFGYGEGGYAAADTLQPFGGYWLKASVSGSIILGGGLAKDIRTQPVNELIGNAMRIVIVDAGGQKHYLYLSQSEQIRTGKISPSLFDLPPVPPAGTPDARFSSGRMLELTPEGASTTLSISLTGFQGAHATIGIDRCGKADSCQVAVKIGNSFLPIRLNSSVNLPTGVAKIAMRLENSTFRVLPSTYSLEQNYPDPFNPSTTIEYSIPVASHVRLTIYDVLGRVVATLANGVESAGYKQVVWNASSVGSGTYFYQLEAVPTLNSSNHTNLTKKLLVIK